MLMISLTLLRQGFKLADVATAEPRYLRSLQAHYKASRCCENVCRLLGVTELPIGYPRPKPRSCLVLTYYTGGTIQGVLQQQVQSGQPLPLLTVLRWTRDVLVGLRSLHEQGVVSADALAQV